MPIGASGRAKAIAAVPAADPAWGASGRERSLEKGSLENKNLSGLGWDVRRCLQGFTDETGEPENISRAGFFVFITGMQL